MGTLNRAALLAAALGLGAFAGFGVPEATDERRYFVQGHRRGGKPTSTPSKAKARELRVKKARLAKKSRAKNRGR